MASSSSPKGTIGGGGAGAGTALSTTDSNTNNGAANSTMAGEEKARLTEEEKKQNHIASEQKRRLAIREGFDRLANIVPGMQGMGRSEAMVLKRTVEFMVEQLELRKKLIEECDAKGIEVDDSLRVEVQRLEQWEEYQKTKKVSDSGNDSDEKKTIPTKRKSSQR